jgi:helicase
MVSYFYAKQMKPEERPRLPLLLDSGGFVSLFAAARVVTEGELGVIEVHQEGGISDRIDPRAVLELQELVADVAFTLDFPIPPAMERQEAERRQALTIVNAHWALANRRRADLPLFACVQGWDIPSMRACARAYAGTGFDGIAIGGLVPRAHNLEVVLGIVEAVREEIGDLPLHVLGLGKPDLARRLYDKGVDSVDSSSYVKLAADGRLWEDPSYCNPDPTPTERLHLALCNLALATQQSLPLSAASLHFKTSQLSKWHL